MRFSQDMRRWLEMEPTHEQLIDLWERFTSEDGILGPLAFRYDVLRVIECSQDLARNKKRIGECYPDDYIMALHGVQESFDVLILRMKALEEMQKKMTEEVA